MEIYKAALEAFGRAGEISEFPIRRDVFVAEDRGTALKIVEPILNAGYRGVRGNPLDVLIVGGPSDFLETLEQLRALGTTQVLIRFMVPAQEHILQAIRIIGERVIPQIS
jgi:alkanesulfonate monooxygenase SsuD/methylene tetrahydromethanopterin reductase-like flavin-dependent oxidoreductase (luciferase family)